ncbi:MAG: ABC transporter ATP-binding protein [Isosphaeraceae bacterium]|jgi:putative ABC transport system permease protein|nr:MAG: ABC transporter ATP-binding protein [Isosphaeraceae bacterium]
MKFLGYILRNARRNPVRSLLTIGSIAVCGFLTVAMLSLFSSADQLREEVKGYDRVIVMSSQGFAQPVPIALKNEIIALDQARGLNAIARRAADGKPLISPFSWFGGKYKDEQLSLFAQFGIDPDVFFDIYTELTLPADQLAAFKARPDAVVVGRKLAADKKIAVGDKFPLKGEIYNYDLDLTVVGIFDGPENRDLRSCYFNWDYLNEGLLSKASGVGANNAGTILIKCASTALIPPLCQAIDQATANSDRATKSQTEDAFIGQFAEFTKDLQTYINLLGVAVAFALLIICGVAMAMSMRERTREVAVLRAIGFRKPQILGMVLAEAVLIAGLGGLIGTGTALLLSKNWDAIAPLTMGFFPYLRIPPQVALAGIAGSLLIGLIGGYWPALRAASIPVVDGLRKVV